MRHPRSPTDEADLDRARRRARAFADDSGLAKRLLPYESFRWEPKRTAHPTLHLDDVSAIPFLIDIAGVEEYQHRGRLRAGDGDVYVTVTPDTNGYESYCRERLRLGAPEHLVADPVGPPIAVARACSAGRTRRRLLEIARDAGGLVIHPYMGVEDVWELAAILASDSRREIRVVGPPPPVTWIANDKATFGELVSRVLGTHALVETRVSTHRREIAADLRNLASRHPRVALKRTRCASAMGNAVFASRDVHTPDAAAEAVDRFLKRTEWPDGEEVLTVAWLDTDHSPSTQLWIPHPESGPPQLDGIYDQILVGEEKVFVGSRPTALPAPVRRELARGALIVATALQELGYVGRCSFDHLVAGDPKGDFDVVFTECNGRWGGTSTPMSFVDRMFGRKRRKRPPYRAQDVVFPRLIGARLGDLLDLVDEHLFSADPEDGRFIFYNVGPLEAHGKFDVISLGRDQEGAERGIEELLPSLIGV